MTATTPVLTDDLATRPVVARIRSILVRPRAEWTVIDAEPATVMGLYAGYIAPLAAIAPVASLIGMSVLGIRLPFGGTYRVPLGSAIAGTLTHYVLTLVSVYVLALIIDGLAPTFGGERNTIQALKVAAYASTASWIAGVFAIVPWFGFLGVFGLYSLYLIYLGLPILMRSPADKALGYSAAVIVSAIVLFIVVGIITSRFMVYPTAGFPVR